MEICPQIFLISTFIYCNVDAQNNPWSRNIFPGVTVKNSNSEQPITTNYSTSSTYDSCADSPCGCSYNTISSSTSRISSSSSSYSYDSTCSGQSGDQTCDCVLGCGCTNVGDNVCSAVNLINKTFSDVIYGAPYMLLVVPESQEFAQVDNTCFTYFNLTGSSQAVVYISIVYIDGSNKIQSLLVSDGGPGVVLAGGPNLAFKDKTFGDVPGCSANTVYRCYLWGDGVRASDRDYQYATYAVGPITSSRDSSCGLTAVQTLIDAGYDQRYRILPGKLPHKCVTSQPGTPASNTCAAPDYHCYK